MSAVFGPCMLRTAETAVAHERAGNRASEVIMRRGVLVGGLVLTLLVPALPGRARAEAPAEDTKALSAEEVDRLREEVRRAAEANEYEAANEAMGKLLKNDLKA